MSEPSVAIVGGGASGVLTALHLLRRDPARTITIIEQGAAFARGLAYGTKYDCHLLNVRAERMSALANEDDHFLNWWKGRNPEVSAQDFAPRRVYGQYLSFLYEQMCASHANVRPIRAKAIGMERDEGKQTWKLEMDNGSTVGASIVVLALGNLPPANPFRFAPPSNATYFQDPWVDGATRGLPEEAAVFIIGTGLTMLDLVLALRSEGHRGVIHAISRRGLLPHSHRAHPLLTLSPPRLSACRMLHWLRAEIEGAARNGRDWRCVLDGMRPHTRHIWHAWTVDQRRSFLRHARPYWDSHRHRCAPVIGAQIRALIEDGVLRIHRGRVQAMREIANGVEVQWSGSTVKAQSLSVSRVINCTGPASNFAKCDLPLVSDLYRNGWLAHEPLGLGFETDMDGRIVGRDHQVVPGLFAMGPLRRAAWWESVAIPEIREQAESLAEHVGHDRLVPSG